MAHSHEQGLLARMGFADPDRKDRRHTLACQYLALPSVVPKIAKLFGIATTAQKPDPVTLVIQLPNEEKKHSYNLQRVSEQIQRGDSISYIISSNGEYVHIGDKPPVSLYRWSPKFKAIFEKKITTGRNDFLVGFADLVVAFSIHEYSAVLSGFSHVKIKVHEKNGFQLTGKDIDISVIDSVTFDWREEETRSICTCLIEVKVHPVDVSDIIKQMKMYGDFTYSACATCYQLRPSDKKMLEDSGIKHIYLGDGFKAYCQAHDEERPVQEEGL